MHKRCNAPIDNNTLKNSFEKRSGEGVSAPFKKRAISQHYRTLLIGDEPCGFKRF